MVDRPILFSAPMILALLAGRKTQTRRLAERWVERGECRWVPSPWQRVQPGDRLWVREAVRAEELSLPPFKRRATRTERERLARTTILEFDPRDGTDGVRYVADDVWLPIENTPEAGDRWDDLFHYNHDRTGKKGGAVPAIHMPRWASRITLTITDVRVQRLQEISETDAIAEGAEPVLVPPDGGSNPHREGFRDLWERLHGRDAWDANPEVVALSFAVALHNIAKDPFHAR